MDITSRELDFLNFYRASDLHGGLILGQVARRARGSELVLDLTRHSAEEVMHAQLHAGVLEPAHERVAADAAARVEVAVPGRVLEEHREQRRLTADVLGGGHRLMMASRAP